MGNFGLFGLSIPEASGSCRAMSVDLWWGLDHIYGIFGYTYEARNKKQPTINNWRELGRYLKGSWIIPSIFLFIFQLQNVFNGKFKVAYGTGSLGYFTPFCR